MAFDQIMERGSSLTNFIAWINIVFYIEGTLVFFSLFTFLLFDPVRFLGEVQSIAQFEDVTYGIIYGVILAGLIYCVMSAALASGLLQGVKKRNYRLMYVWLVYTIALWFVKFMIVFLTTKYFTIPLSLWFLIGGLTALDWISIFAVQKYSVAVRYYEAVEDSIIFYDDRVKY